jgi:predicted permease
MTPWIRRLWAWIRAGRLDRELADEMSLHLELRRQALIDDGMDPREAAAAARRGFGNVASIREESRSVWSFPHVDLVLRDIAYATRLLRKSPVFTAVAVLSLAVGIGSTTAVFSLVDAVLLRKLPVARSDDLVILRWRSTSRMPMPSLSGNWNSTASGQSSTSFSLPTFEALRRARPAGVRVFGFAGYMPLNIAIDGPPEIGAGQAVSGNYFDTLGLLPAAGRLLTESDDRPEAAPVAVISEPFWRARLGGADIAGRSVVVNGIPVSLVGVMPKGFASTLQVGDAPVLAVPLALRERLERSATYRTADHWWVLMMARLPPDATPDAVRPALAGVLRQSIADGNPALASDDLPELELLPGSRGQMEARDGMREPLQAMALIVGVVLLVACAIVANLLIARGQARVRELTVRVAIGASRARVIGQLVTEGLVLAALGSVCGLVAATWIAGALTPALSGATGFVLPIGTDWRVVAFTAGLATLSTGLFAVLPAFRSTDVNVADGLQEQTRTMTALRHRRAASQSLVVIQIALSMMLVTAAALLGRSVLNLRGVATGFDPSNLLIFGVDPSRNGYTPERSIALAGAMLTQLSGLNGVRSAALTSQPIFGAGGASTIAALPGDPPLELGSPAARAFFNTHRTFVLSVSDNFFATMGIPLARGRTFSAVDTAESQRVAVINQALARQVFGTSDPIGQRFKTDLRHNAPFVEVVGVCENARLASLRREPPPTAYFSYRQRPAGSPTFALKTLDDPMRLVPAVREVMRQADPNLPVFGLQTEASQIAQTMRRERLLARLAALLGVITLALSGIGLYGLLAYTVARRTREIGLRMALGAGGLAVRWIILRQALWLIAAGLLVGTAFAIAGARVLQTILFGLTPADPISVATAALVMMAAGIAAAYIPARRAARVDPIVALRAE